MKPQTYKYFVGTQAPPKGIIILMLTFFTISLLLYTLYPSSPSYIIEEKVCHNETIPDTQITQNNFIPNCPENISYNNQTLIWSNLTIYNACIYSYGNGTNLLFPLQYYLLNNTQMVCQWQEVNKKDYQNWTLDDCYNKFWDGNDSKETSAFKNYMVCANLLSPELHKTVVAMRNGKDFVDDIPFLINQIGCSQINSTSYQCGDKYMVVRE